MTQRPSTLILSLSKGEGGGKACLTTGMQGMEVTVYIVRCSDGSYYTGLTKQPIEARIWEHNEGIYKGYTFKRRPVQLVFTETYDRILDAIARERQIKGWSRAKKEALIRLAYEDLPALSANRQGHPRPSTSSG